MQELEKEEYLGNIKRSYSNAKGIAIVETQYKNKVYEGWHSHENAHITLFVKGGTIEKRKNESIAVTTGSLLFYHSDEKHLNYETILPSNNINIEIEQKFLREFHFSEELIENSILDKPNVKFNILKMYKECLIQDNFSDDSISMLFSQIIHNPLLYQESVNRPQWIKHLFELLNDCWFENPSLQSLAQILNVNPITISKHFPKYFGCTFGEYMRRLKIEKSLTFIQENNMSLTEIAFHCGFADQSHFTRTFKNQTGFLPKEIQKF